MTALAVLVAALMLASQASLAVEPRFEPSPDLRAAAGKEGKLVFYTANFLEAEQEITKRFSARFPDVSVELLRAPTGQLVTRIKTEAAANKLGADVIDISDRALCRSMLDLFAPYAPPNAADYPQETRTGDKLWPRTGTAWTIAYNPALVPNPPTSWHDLIKPEYGKLGLGQTIIMSGGAPFTRAMFERRVLGEDYWAKQAALSPKLFPSQAPMVDAMIRGEIAVAPLVTLLAIPLERQGAPIKWFFPPEGAPTTVFCAGLVRGAAHPNAAKLFLDWALSREGQAVMTEVGSFSSLRDAPLPPGVNRADIKTWLPDEKDYETVFAPWTEDWNRAYNYRQ